MEASETTPASWWARLGARLADLEKPPRRWWFPPSSRRDDVLPMSEAARHDYHKEVQQAHEKFSETVRLTVLSLLGFVLFCLLIALGTPDSALLVADPTTKMPFADVQVSFQSFLILARFLPLVVTLYLHIFNGYWLDLERDYQRLTLSRATHEPPMERLPTLFSLDHPVPRLPTACIFYGLAPFVLLTITWKASARMECGIPLAFLTGLVTVALVYLQIRRCPASRHRGSRWRWGVRVGIGGDLAVLLSGMITPLAGEQTRRRGSAVFAGMSDVVVVPRWFPRPLNIVRVDLKGQWLPQVNLCHASARLANLEGANLEGATLQGANLREVRGLTPTQLQAAHIDERTRLPDGFTSPP
jgi:hypothetical protein